MQHTICYQETLGETKYINRIFFLEKVNSVVTERVVQGAS